MTEQCEFCQWLATKQNLVYEDEELAVALAPHPFAVGHLIAYSRSHQTILEQVSPKSLQSLAVICNRFSVLLFEALNAQGTNVLVQNGTAAGQIMPHVGFHIIPRFENDGLGLAWKSRPLSEEQMASVELAVRGDIEAQHPQPVQQKPSAPQKVTDIMLRQLERIP